MDRYLNKVKRLFKNSDTKQLLGLLVILVSLPVAVYLVQQTALYFSRAQLVPAHVSFSPESATMPPDLDMKVMINSSTGVGFVRMEVNFDNTKLQLWANPIPSERFKTIVSMTTAAQANASGRVVAVVALSPGDPAPTGLFDVITLPLRTANNTPNQATELTINEPGVQIVDVSANEMAFTWGAGRITLNPTVATNTPTPVIGTNPITTTPTSVPTNTSTPTTVPTNTSTPTPTSVIGTRIPTNTPTLVIGTNPATPTVCNGPGDANHDCSVNLLDYSILFQAFGTQPGDPNWDVRADFVRDDRINLLDYSILFTYFEF